MIRPTQIEIAHMKNPLGIDVLQPVISWNVEGAKQGSYRITLSVRDEKILDTSWVQSDRMSTRIDLTGKVQSGDRVNVSVFLCSTKGDEGEGKSYFEYGLFQRDWKAFWINPELKKYKRKEFKRPVSYLTKKFEISASDLERKERIRVYATAHGVYSIYLNGVRLEEHIMAPGVSQSEKRLQVQTYAPGRYLKAGENEIIVTVSDGWWRGTATFDGIHNGFGKDIAFLLQMQLENKVICMTDENWQASQSGPLRYADNMQGEEYDANMEIITDWHEVKKADFGYETLAASNCPPLVEQEVFTPVLLRNGEERLLDFGQNIAGYVSFSIEGKEGQRVVLTHGEALDEHGKLTLDNFQSTKYRCRQEVLYCCKEGKNTYKPTHTYMGFRYVKVEGLDSVNPENFRAHAIYSDLEITASFSCGNEDVNQLFQNALWSLKGNLQDIPTDCPTREKGAFSGDLQAYSHTMLYLMNSYSMFQKFIDNQACGQWKDGCVRQIVADPRKRGLWDGAAGWCDSFEVIPTNLGARYNDYALFEQYYTEIKKWVDFLLTRAHKTRWKNRKRPYHDYFVDKGIHWGEWLEPDVDTVKTISGIFKNGAPEVATAYLAYACEKLSEQAGRMGNDRDQAFYQEEAQKAKKAYHAAFLPDGMIHTKRMCELIRPIVLNVLTEEEKEKAAEQLNELVIANGYHLNTGFLTTHELLRTLSNYGYVDTAYRLLLQTDSPGWLFAVQHGATTVWENWNGVDDKGNPHDSQNHYSYGAVVGWLLDSSCGIRVENEKITVCPLPNKELGFAEGKYQSPLGQIISKWKVEEGVVSYEISIPDNCEATIRFMNGETHLVESGTHRYSHAINASE